MDIATSTISNIVAAGIPHAAQEARRDSIARETIPQINQTASSLNGQGVAQGNAQLAPANSNLYAQVDNQIRSAHEKRNSEKKQSKEVKGHSEAGKTATSAKAETVSAVGISSQSLSGGVSKNAKTKASLGGSFGSMGAAYSSESDKRRAKGEGYSSKVIADTYNGIRPNESLGQGLDILG